MRIPFAIVGVFLLALVQSLSAQELPSKIRGYKVYNANISVRSSEDKGAANNEREAVITIDAPEIVDYGLTGITLAAGAEIAAVDQSGRVDFLSFRDFKINGIRVEIEEYKHEFRFKKGESISLPKPAQIFIGTLNLARAARNELLDPKKKWSVTGTVFVFGKFKKCGMSFKRVVPIKIDITIANPLRS